MPILWHIMKHYSHYGHNDFIICVGDVDLNALLAQYRFMGKTVTIMSVNVERSKGILEIRDGLVRSFREKSVADSAQINGGVMVVDAGPFWESVLSDEDGRISVLEKMIGEFADGGCAGISGLDGIRKTIGLWELVERNTTVVGGHDNSHRQN